MAVGMIVVLGKMGELQADDGRDVARDIDEGVDAVGDQRLRRRDEADAELGTRHEDVDRQAERHGQTALALQRRAHLGEFALIRSASATQSIRTSLASATAGWPFNSRTRVSS